MAEKPSAERRKELKALASGQQPQKPKEPETPLVEEKGKEAPPAQAEETPTPPHPTLTIAPPAPKKTPTMPPANDLADAILLLAEQMAQANQLNAKLVATIIADEKPILDLVSVINDCLKGQSNQQKETTKQLVTLQRLVTKLGEKPSKCPAKAVGDVSMADVLLAFRDAGAILREVQSVKNGQGQAIEGLRGNIRSTNASHEKLAKTVGQLDQRFEALEKRVREVEAKLGIGEVQLSIGGIEPPVEPKPAPTPEPTTLTIAPLVVDPKLTQVFSDNDAESETPTRVTLTIG